MTPRLSFIITAHNRPKALRTCLSSLIQQTREDWEAIVMDNSEPGPLAAEHFELSEMDKRISYKWIRDRTAISSPKPLIHSHSLYLATEIGIARTTGEWLAFPNDDSYYCPWYVERMLESAIANAWDLVYCDLVGGSAKGGHYLLTASPQLCSIDKTNFLMRRQWFTGFPADPDDYPQADGLMVEDLVRRGIRHGHVPQILVVHN